MEEFRERVERALASHMAEPKHGERDEMKLLGALGTALPNAASPLPETDIVWTKALELAEKLGEKEYQLRALWGWYIYRMYIGDDFRGALACAEKFCAVADKKGDVAAQLVGYRLTGTVLHYLGDHTNARRHLDRVFNQFVAPFHIADFHTDHRAVGRTRVSTMMSSILWMQGFPDQAVRTARSTLDEARATNHALALCNALAHAVCPIALYVGDLAEAERLVTTLLEHSAKQALTVMNAQGRCLKGTLLLARGDVAGLTLLRAALDGLREARFGLRYPVFLGTLAQGLAAAGQTAEARTAIDEALERCERSDGRWCLPELLRIKGQLLRQDGSFDAIEAAEDHYMQALEWARRQEAISWELRAATSLAELWRARGKIVDAEQLLSSVYIKFTEGFETSDLKTAHALITELRTKTASS